MKKHPVASVAMLFLALASANADVCSPPRLLKIVVEDRSPDMSGHDYGALPRTIYRYRTTFARIEEPIDAANNIHGLIVFNEPNAWIVNLSKREGTHLVDNTPPLIVRVALFADRARDESFPRELLSLSSVAKKSFLTAARLERNLCQAIPQVECSRRSRSASGRLF